MAYICELHAASYTQIRKNTILWIEYDKIYFCIFLRTLYWMNYKGPDQRYCYTQHKVRLYTNDVFFVIYISNSAFKIPMHIKKLLHTNKTLLFNYHIFYDTCIELCIISR